MTDFERIRDSALGYLTPEERVSWVPDLSREGTDYDRAYQKLLSARERLCRRPPSIWHRPWPGAFMMPLWTTPPGGFICNGQLRAGAGH